MTTGVLVRRTPRWAHIAAHAVPVVVLPSSLWRLAMVVGIPVGFSAQVLREDYGIPGSGYLILPLLSVVQEALALATLLLLRDEVALPGWVPRLGGARVPDRVVVAGAVGGGAVLTFVTLSQLVLWHTVGTGELSGTARGVMGWCYAPLLLWGPLVLAVVRARQKSALEPAERA